MFLVLSHSCFNPNHWSQVFSREWRRSWSSADRRCSNYIWMISNCIPYKGVPYIRGLTVIWIIMIMLHNNTSVNVTHWYLGDLDVVLKMQFLIFYYLLVFSVLVIMPSYECHRHMTLLVTTIESLTARMCKTLYVRPGGWVVQKAWSEGWFRKHPTGELGLKVTGVELTHYFLRLWNTF